MEHGIVRRSWYQIQYNVGIYKQTILIKPTELQNQIFDSDLLSNKNENENNKRLLSDNKSFEEITNIKQYMGICNILTNFLFIY